MFGRAFWVTAIAAVATMSFAGTAITGSVTPPTSRANAATATIGKYTFGTPAYTLNTTDPRNVDSIVFTITSSPDTKPTFVKARPVSTTTNWYTCTVTGTSSPYTATCATTSPQWTLVNSLTNMTSLTIVARD